MAYPTDADTDSEIGGGSIPAAADATNSPSHSSIHRLLGDAVQAIETKLGIGAGPPGAGKVLLGDASGSSWSATPSGLTSVTATTFTGALVGNASTASSAAALTAAVDIGGVSFDGSGSINLPGVNTAGTQDTSGNATTATTATEATTVAVDSSSDSTSQVALINGTGSPQAIKYDGALDWDGTSNVLKISGNTVWHAGNDGSGSGLDADTLDGIGSGQFLRSDTNDTFTGSRLDLPLGATSSGNVPLTFGDMDSGIYSSGGGTLGITLQGGTTVFDFTTGAFRPVGTDADLGVNIINETWNNVYYEGTLTDVSDERLKTHEEASLGLSFLNRLSPYSGHYIKNPDIQFEFMNAQDVRAGLVAEGRDPVRSAMWTEFEDENSTQAIGIDAFIPVLVKAVQELTARLEALEAV